jgi:hypothetical protein
MGCIDPYTPPAIEQDSAVLVIDGFINTNGESTIRLSRSQNISDTDEPPFETGATLWLEDEAGAKIFLLEAGSGKYTLPIQSFPSNKYRLNIKTQNLKEYRSDFEPVKSTPQIDSLTWIQGEDNNVRITVTTHDTENTEGFYRWTFEETWMYTSAFQSLFSFNFETKRVELREDDIFNCYRNSDSNEILIESTTRLSKNIVSNFPIKSIRSVDERLRYKYSLLVKEISITDRSFKYWQQLKINNENLGTLSAPIPAVIQGNVKNINEPQEMVIGFFEISSVSTARIFISQEDLRQLLNYETPYATCQSLDMLNKDLINFSDSYKIINAITDGPTVIGYRYASNRCVDCRLTGGTTTKPDFWP